MQIDKSTVTRLLKKPAGSKEMQDNLYCEVGTGKRKAIHFRFYWTESGQRQYRKIGKADKDSSASYLKQLNGLYLETLSNYQRGITPRHIEALDARREAHDAAYRKRQPTVEEVFTQYLDNHLALTNQVMAENDLKRYRKHVHPHIGKKVANYVTRQELQAIVDRIAKTHPPQSKYIAQYFQRVWNYTEDVGTEIDVRVARKLRAVPVTKRTRVATDDEIRLILREGYELYQAFLYTGQRPSDIRLMRWSEIEGNWLNITPQRYKTRRGHRVYLTKTVQRLMKEHKAHHRWNRPIESDFVWPNLRGQPLNESTLQRHFNLLDWASVSPSHLVKLEMRDFRRTCYTFIEKEFGIHISGAIAGHSKGGVMAVYGQYEYDAEKEAAMKKWEKHLNELKRG